jgi:hypothetical protein
MKLPPYFFVMDCESVGLHGETFAVGWVVVSPDGVEHDHGMMACPMASARGTSDADIDPNRAWVAANVPVLTPSHDNPLQVRDAFWTTWLPWKDSGAVLAADCAWPVEARFLAACVDDHGGTDREWQGPYPLHEIASFRLAAGFDPLATVDRLPDELPVHDPLADARQSARLLVEALDVLLAMEER